MEIFEHIEQQLNQQLEQLEIAIETAKQNQASIFEINKLRKLWMLTYKQLDELNKGNKTK